MIGGPFLAPIVIGPDRIVFQFVGVAAEEYEVTASVQVFAARKR